jgi:hypothetical protein
MLRHLLRASLVARGRFVRAQATGRLPSRVGSAPRGRTAWDDARIGDKARERTDRGLFDGKRTPERESCYRYWP